MDARELSRVTVQDLQGAEVRLGDLWRRQPAVLVWLRHYGCMFCIEQTAEMRAVRPEIEELGARLYLIGNGGQKAAADFKEQHAPDVTLFTDPELRSYRAIRARSGVLSTMGPRSWASGVRALKSGARQTAVKGHPFQQGAVMIVAPPGRVLFSHISRAAGDHPRVDAVLDALRETQLRPAAGA